MQRPEEMNVHASKVCSPSAHLQFIQINKFEQVRIQAINILVMCFSNITDLTSKLHLFFSQ